MKIPYIAGPVVRHPHFYGRQQLVEELLDDRHQCIYLIGNRRMGKTSLLIHLEAHAPIVSLLLNMQSTEGDPVKMGIKLARQVERKMKNVPELNNVKLKAGSDICDVVETLSESAEDGDFPILLMCDESEELLSLDRECLRRLRSALQDAKNFRTILAATKRLSELNNRSRSWRTSPFLHGFAVRYIPPFCDQDAAELICQINNPEGQVQVDEELQLEIMRVTGKHPYLIQYLCSRLFQTEGRLRHFEERDLVVSHEISTFFQSDYDSLSPSERAVCQMLSGQSSIGENQLCDALKTRRDNLRSHLDILEYLGYVTYHEEQYQIANHFLRTWLNMGRIEEKPPSVSDEASLEVSNLGANPISRLTEPVTMTFEQRSLLVSALLTCSTISDRGARDRVVNDLPDHMRGRIQRNSTDNVDVANIVSSCLGFGDGIQKLVEIVQFYEGESSAMQKVKESMRR